MQLDIKLYGGLKCNNQDLSRSGMKKFQLNIEQGICLAQVYRMLKLDSQINLVSIVNGHAQSPQYVLTGDSSISIFPPMADRQYDPFERLK